MYAAHWSRSCAGKLSTGGKEVSVKISGFTLVRNGTRFDYPYLESLRSLLPLVDELVINVGIGDDDTIERIRSFSEGEGAGKAKWFESRWPLDDPQKKKG